jgi:hypothetical protein
MIVNSAGLLTIAIASTDSGRVEVNALSIKQVIELIRQDGRDQGADQEQAAGF